MYLKEIKAHGFKSFADHITITLGKGTTGIVGPNGSGKSNVVDAVRWVLGEQSVKSLRGDGNMTDVIFSGSKSRKSQGLASVTLVFNNEDHYLPLDYAEVSIKRIVYKDGSNEYYINNTKCRLKDVTDLLLDSGIAKESFNIISQGKIDEIILTKPQDRRVIFEEAAGVLKYKKRKEESFRKLEKTHENMKRVADILTELEEDLKPLKKQKEKALEYQEKYDQLKVLDISYLTDQITKIHDRYEKNKEKIKELNEQILTLTTTNSKSEVKILEYKHKIEDLTTKESEESQRLLQLTTKLEKINSEKQMLLERKKYEVEDSKLHTIFVSLKEQKLALEVEIEKIAEEIQMFEEQLKKQEENLQKIFSNRENLNKKRQGLEQTLYQTIREKENVAIKIQKLKQAIEEQSNLPYPVRKILERNFYGVHNTIGNLFEVEEKYATAIATSLGTMSSVLVVDDEQVAKEAIRYLKEKNLGRVTFFPKNIIRSRRFSEEIERSFHTLKGYLSLAVDFIKFDPQYKQIMENQLGNVLVADTLENANEIAKQTDHRYKIVTLDGEILHPGGSITGGKQKENSAMMDKFNLEKQEKEKQTLEDKITNIEEEMNQIDQQMKAVDNEYYLENKNYISSKEEKNIKNASKQDKYENLKKLEEEIHRNEQVLNRSIDEEENKIIERYYEVLKEKQECESLKNKITMQKKELQEEREEYEFTIRRENALFNTKNKELKTLEIEVNRDDVKLDSLLSDLNENYNITYENAKKNYFLDISFEEAELKISMLKKDIREMGPINMEAPEEYDKKNERYTFLKQQQEDLSHAESTLLEIIKEMDDVMIRDFKTSFDLIRSNFQETFKDLFKGGHADLKLTDPNNLLETGVEIVASPPGKSLRSIHLLSGGEKTFTAISLLFAILKSRTVPFCILDEVEAALDESNVASFGEYLKTLKEKTQFILITHKKKTMEYVDVLYGITMQESGVSKLVSVKLEDLEEK